MAPIEILPLEIFRLIVKYCLAWQVSVSDIDDSFQGYIIWNEWNSKYPTEVFNLALASKMLRSSLSSVLFENLKFVKKNDWQKLLCADIFASPLTLSSPKLVFSGKTPIYSKDMLRSVSRLILKLEQASSDSSMSHPPLHLITPDAMPNLKILQIEIYNYDLCNLELLTLNSRKFDNDLCVHLSIFASHKRNESALAAIINKVDFHLLVTSLTLSICPIQFTQKTVEQIVRFRNLRKFVVQCPEKLFIRLTTDGDCYKTSKQVQFIKKLPYLENLFIFPEFPFQKVINRCEMSTIKRLAIDIAYFQFPDLSTEVFKSIQDLTLFIEDTETVPEKLPFTKLKSLYIATCKHWPMKTLEYLTATNCNLSELAIEGEEASEDFSRHFKSIFSGICRLKICKNAFGLKSQPTPTVESILNNAPNLKTLHIGAISERLFSLKWLADEMIEKTISEHLEFIFVNTEGISLEISHSPVGSLESNCFNKAYETIGQYSNFCHPVKELSSNELCQAIVVEVSELRKRLRDHNFL